MKKEKSQSGQAAILIIFVLGMISVLIGISLVQTGFSESLMGRANPLSAKAFYIANSGVEEALYKLNKDSSYGLATPLNFNLSTSEGQATVKVSTDDPINNPDQRTIESAAKSGSYIRKIKALVVKAAVMSPFKYAIQAGEGGIEFTKKVKAPFIVGNVYSNGNITGYDCTDIVGSASASGEMSNLAITGNAQAQPINVCSVGGTETETPAPTIDPPRFDLTIMQNYLKKFPTITGPYTVSNGSIGNITINGNLTLDSNVTITGPIWATGTVYIDADITLDPTINSSGISQVLVGEKLITVKGDSFPFGVFLLLISTYTPPTSVSDLCADQSIIIEANINNILYYAPNGCLDVDAPTAAGSFTGSAIGKKIIFKQLQSGLQFDNALGTAQFGLTRSGGWQTISFKEE